MLLISFLFSFNYNILKSTKDAIIVTCSTHGVEAIPFIKMGIILPLSILFVYLFSKLSNRFDREKRLYAIASIFLVYFAVFALFLFPFREKLYLERVANFLQGRLQRGHEGFIQTIYYWPFSTFYAMSELWGAIVLNVGFWSFVNDVTHVNEAKRFYPVMGICLNISGIVAGLIGNLFIHLPKRVSYLAHWEHWDQSLALIMGSVLISGVLALVTFRYLNKLIAAEGELPIPPSKRPERPLVKTSFVEDFRLLLRSPYILCMATTIFAFGFVIGSTELLWKDHVRAMYATTASYYRLSNHFNIMTGLLATPMAMVSGWCIRRLGWTFSALLSPILFGITSLGFFGYLLLPGPFSHFSTFVGSNPATLAFFFGASLTVLSRTIKYTLFDATKELAFIPLDRKTKLQGKAAIDGIGSRLGKIGASILYATLLSLLNQTHIDLLGIKICTPYMLVACFASLVMWTIAVLYLGGEFQKLTHKESPTENA